MNWTATGAIGLALAVILGAFGAHGLRTRLDAYSMSVYERAVFYHFIHAMGLLVVSLLPRLGAVSLTAGSWVCALLLTAVVIFSYAPRMAIRTDRPAIRMDTQGIAGQSVNSNHSKTFTFWNSRN